MFKKLTPKQEQFCREYIIDLNATKAAIRAGYSRHTAKEIGHENLTKPHICDRIAVLKEENITRVSNETELELTADRVLAEGARVAFFRPEALLTFDPDTGVVKIALNADNFHLLAGITGLKVKEGQHKSISECGNELVREVIEFTFKSDKMRGLENLMKHLGLLKEKAEDPMLDDLVKALQKGRERVAMAQRRDEVLN